MAAFSTLKMLCHIADTITKTLFWLSYFISDQIQNNF